MARIKSTGASNIRTLRNKISQQTTPSIFFDGTEVSEIKSFISSNEIPDNGEISDHKTITINQQTVGYGDYIVLQEQAYIVLPQLALWTIYDVSEG